jgi:hypothetical protein
MNCGATHLDYIPAQRPGMREHKERFMPLHALPLRLAYTFGESKGLEKEINEIQNLVIERDSPYYSHLRRKYLRCGAIIELFERHKIFEDFKEQYWPGGNTSAGKTSQRRYLNNKKKYEDFLAGTYSEPSKVDSMEYFFYNTDAGVIKDEPRPRFGVLIDGRFAAVGGDRKKYGEQLGKLSPDDILLMYENLVGIVAVGRVLERWDESTYSDPLYYTQREITLLTGGAHEYRIAVDWFIDISYSPISVQQLRELLGYTPRGTVKKIVEHRAKIEKLINDIQNSLPYDQHQINSYLPSKKDFESAYRMLAQLGEAVSVDSVLEQVEIIIKNNGLSLRNDWRMLTERNIAIWANKN